MIDDKEKKAANSTSVVLPPVSEKPSPTMTLAKEIAKRMAARLPVNKEKLEDGSAQLQYEEMMSQCVSQQIEDYLQTAKVNEDSARTAVVLSAFKEGFYQSDSKVGYTLYGSVGESLAANGKKYNTNEERLLYLQGVCTAAMGPNPQADILRLLFPAPPIVSLIDTVIESSSGAENIVFNYARALASQTQKFSELRNINGILSGWLDAVRPNKTGRTQQTFRNFALIPQQQYTVPAHHLNRN